MTALYVILSITVAVMYYLLAAAILPILRRQSPWTGSIKTLGVCFVIFFLGCGTDHVEMGMHALGGMSVTDMRHHLVTVVPQLIGGWGALFIIWTKKLNIRVTAPADRRVNQLERELFEARRLEAIGQLSAGIAHEFMHVLGIVKNYSRFLDKTIVKLSPEIYAEHGDKMRGDVRIIEDAVQHGETICKQFKLFARKATAKIELIKVHEVVEQALSVVYYPGMTIERNLRPVPEVCADRRLLEAVIFNMAQNARDAMPTGGTLTVTTRYVRNRRNHYVLLKVADSGTGMTDDVKRQIFQPFFTTKPQGVGTGLGLSACYGSIKKFGGSIQVESEPGMGTTFLIKLPVGEDACRAFCEEPMAESFSASAS